MSAILKLLAEHQADAHHEDMCATCREAQAAIDAGDARAALRQAAIDAAYRWACLEFNHAKNLGRGGPGLYLEAENAAIATRAAINALAQVLQ